MASNKRKSAKRNSRTGRKKVDLAVAGALDHATELHRTGDLERAQQAYMALLRRVPNHGRCLYLLGRLYSQQGDLEQAASHMARGLALDSSSASGFNNLGTVYQRLDQRDEAESCFVAALEKDPELIEALINLGSLHQTNNRTSQAESCFRAALAKDPASAQAAVNLGAILRLKGDLDAAERVLRKPIDQGTELASAHNNLGVVLHEQGRLMDAFSAFKKALELAPDYVEAYTNLGTVFRDQNQWDGALACYNKALALDETWVDAHNNKGAVLQSQGKWPQAIIHFKRADTLKPDYPPALTNLATILHKSGRHGEAQALYERAIAIDPAYPQAHFGLAELLLFLGDDLQRGWREHFWRWKRKELQDQWRHFPCPLWRGQPLQDKKILVWGEQGIGEEILYATMVPELADLAASVYLECEPRLLGLFAPAFPNVSCFARDDTRIKDLDVDYHCAAADLGAWLRPNLDGFPKRKALFAADPGQTDALRRSYRANNGGPLIGISWHSKNPDMGWEKSIDLGAWERLFRSVGPATFVDLQYGDTEKQRSQLEVTTGITLLHDPSIDQMHDLTAFAAQVAAMDLVVSISNSTVHMAGALGVPTWALLSSAPLWRWFKDRQDCPWYPSVRFFRQAQLGNWDQVIDQVTAEIVSQYK